MTFAEWVNSEYNTDGWEWDELFERVCVVENGDCIVDGNDNIVGDSTIKSGYTYQIDVVLGEGN